MTTEPHPDEPGREPTEGSDPERPPAELAPAQPGEVYGAAPERTTLAWQRTGLGVVVCSFLIFHTAIQLGVLAVGALAGCLGLAVAALAIFGFPAQRYRLGRPADSWRLLNSVMWSVVGLGLLGAATGAMTLFR